MSSIRVGAGLLAIGICVAGMAAEPVNQDTNVPVEAGALDDVTSGASIRASQLIGMNIQNQEGKSLGSVHDIVIDARSGRVRYATVSYGGFLGLGDKLFAVPWGAFHYTRAADGDDYRLVLRVTEEQMKSATGFDQNHWPDFADRNFTSQLDRHYGIESRSDRRRGRVDVRVGPGGVDVDVERRPARNLDR